MATVPMSQVRVRSRATDRLLASVGSGGFEYSTSQVLGLDYLVDAVLVRVDSVKSILRSGVVSKAWASAALREEMLLKFME